MPGTTRTLAEALAAWDRVAIQSQLAAAETERLGVVSRFPLADWTTLPLERYALGTDKSAESFCYAMEFGTPHLCSIAGGSSRKLLIFRRRDTGEWYFDRRFPSLEEAWAATRAGFVKVFESVAAGAFGELGDVPPVDWAPALTTKAAWVYFPATILPIASHPHLEHFWVKLGGQGPIEWGVPGARQLMELVRSRPEFEGWSANEVMYFLYDWSHPKQAARIVKIAPGHDAKLWGDCLAHGYIRVGWDEVGDLRDFATKEEFRARFTEVFGESFKGNQAKISEKANEVWTLLELEPGDLVVANQGTSWGPRSWHSRGARVREAGRPGRLHAHGRRLVGHFSGAGDRPDPPLGVQDGRTDQRGRLHADHGRGARRPGGKEARRAAPQPHLRRDRRGPAA